MASDCIKCKQVDKKQTTPFYELVGKLYLQASLLPLQRKLVSEGYSRSHWILYIVQIFHVIVVSIQREQRVFFYISHDFPLHIVGVLFQSPAWYSEFSVTEHAI